MLVSGKYVLLSIDSDAACDRRVKLSASLRTENLQGFPDTFYLICRKPTPYMSKVVGYQ